MLVTKKEAKQASKKLLSVLLAVVMIMTSMSVCFGTFTFAANDTDALNAFVTAMKCDAMKSFSTTGGNASNSGSGANQTTTKTFTYTAPTYAYYQQVDNVIAKLDAAIKGLDEYQNGAGHNGNTNCQDGWDKDSSADKCTDLGWIRKHLVAALGTEATTLQQVYNLDALLNAALNMDGVSYRNADGQDDMDDTSTQNNVKKEYTNVLVVKTTKVAEKLLTYNSIAEVPNEVETTTTYTLKMFRQNFTTTEPNSCGGTDTVNHYHAAMNTSQTGGVPTITKSNGTTNKAVLTDAETVFANNAAYISAADVNGILALSEDADALALISAAIESAKNSVIDTHTEAVYNHFFDETAIASALKNISDAIQFLGFASIVDELNRLNAINYDSYDEAQLLEHLTAFEAEYKLFTDLEEATQTLIIESFGLDTEAIEATLADIRHDYEIIGIARLKDQINGHVNDYRSWSIDDIDEGTVTSADITTAIGIIENDIALLGDYVEVNVVEVCGATYKSNLAIFKAGLVELGVAAGYNDDFLADYAKYRDEIKNAIDVTSENLLAALQNYDSWYTGLRNLIDTMVDELGQENAEKLFDELNVPMVEYMNNAYVVLNSRTEAEVNTAYDLFDAYKKAYGETVHMVSVSEYKAMRDSVGLINADALYFLDASHNFDLDPVILSKYNEMKDDFPKYAEFLASMGLATFETSTIGDIVREDTVDDIARENEDIDDDGIGEYVADDAKIEKVIKILDAALTNADVSAVLGLDLGTMLSDLVEGAILSDSIINTVVEMLYPLVLSEFGKVFANDLPAKDGDNTVNYKKGLHTTLSDAGFEIYPDLLATELGKTANKEAYAETITRLNAAYNEYVKKYTSVGADKKDAYATEPDPDKVGQTNAMGTAYVVISDTPWNSMEIRDPETGKVNLTWGVDAAKEAGVKGDELKALFYETFDDAVEGLKPLLLALIANKAWNAPTVGTLAKAGPTLFGSVIEAATVDLNLGATANSGYANLLVPVFELLGVDYTDVSKIEGEFLNDATNDVEKIIKAIFDPIFAFVDEIGDAPLDTVLGVLPNLCYALSAGMVTPLLSMLKTKIWYLAPITISDTFSNCAEAPKSPEGQVDIDVGTMLNINDLIDLSDGLNSILKGFGVDIPEINQGLVATLGELTTIETQRKEAIYSGLAAGQAYSIVANKADVLVYLVDYILSALAEPGFLDTIMGLFAGKDEEAPAEGEEAPAEPVALPEIVVEILDNVSENPDAAVAAIVELLNLDKYETFALYQWYDGNNYQATTVVGFNPATEIYLDVDNDWTRAKAEYVYENLDTIVSAVIAMIPAKEGEEKAESLSAMLEGLLGGLFTNETVTELAKLLGTLDLNALLAGDEEAEEESALDVNALVNNLLGIDLSTFAQYKDIADGEVVDFGVTDIDTFVAALSELLAPLNPALDFILNDGDLTIFEGEGTLTLPGYDGYGNAVAPLLYALGCDVADVGEDGVLAAVLGALAGRIEKVIANPIEEIFALLPGLLYFITSNGLSVAIRNLLQPVYVILDTIRPIYDVDLNELLSGLIKEATGDEEFFFDLDALDANFIIDLVCKLTGLNISGLKTVIYDAAAAFNVVEYKSISKLEGQTWKTAEYKRGAEHFDEADVLTVIVSFLLEWITVDENAQALDALLKTDGIVAGIKNVFAAVEIAYKPLVWDYAFDSFEEFTNAYVNGTGIPSDFYGIDYSTNWTDDVADYIVNNLNTIVGDVLAATGSEYKSVADLLKDNVNIFTSANIQAIIDLLAGFLTDIDANLIDAAGALLGVDINGLVAYEVPADIDTAEEFAATLADILSTHLSGLIEWLLLGEDYTFFLKSDAATTITINGAEGYAEGLALVLEALGCENLPAADGETADIISGVLASVAARIDEIFANPVDEVFDLIPNLIYFLNANGINVAIGNTLSAVFALLDKLAALGVEVDLGELIGFDITNISIESLLTLAEEKLGLNLADVKETLVGFYAGKLEAYDTVSTNDAYRVTYAEDVFTKKDVVTILVTLVLVTIKDDANAATLKDLLGEDVYEAILNVISLQGNIDVQNFEWALTEDADTGKVFSAFESSIEFTGEVYGDFYTKENAQYIADNFGDFVNNVIYLLGLDVNGDGDAEATLTDVINGLVGGNLYNSDIIITIRDAIAGLAETLNTSIPAGAHILEVLKAAGIADLGAVADVEVANFSDDRAAFTDALCAVVAPLYPVLEWLLSDADFTFFVDEDKSVLVTLPGAEGYAYGIIPLLEVLECDGIITPAEYYAAIDNGDKDVLLTSILTPLLDRVDVILANPAEEILGMLPNIIYFINSNGVDTVVKNTLNAVYTLLSAIEPIAEIDLYNLIGIDLAEIDFNWLLSKAIELLNGMGYKFSVEDLDALAELTVGTLESYKSANGNTAYKMVYAPDGGIEGGKTEMVTVIERLVITFIADEKNREEVMKLLKEELGMSDEAAKYVDGLIKLIAESIRDTSLGMQLALSAVYYVFYGVDAGVEGAVGGLGSINDAWKEAIDNLGKVNPAAKDLIEHILGWEIFDDLLGTDDGLAPNGLIKFFQKIIDWFKSIVEFFRNLFSFGR